jgi:hypothetical protein
VIIKDLPLGVRYYKHNKNIMFNWNIKYDRSDLVYGKIAMAQKDNEIVK